MTARMSRKDKGDKVFETLCDHVPTIAQAMEITGMTEAQWHAGMSYVRDVLAEVHSEPIVYDAKTKTYALASIPKEVDAYIGKRINEFLISLHRIYDGSFWPAGVKFETRHSQDFKDVDVAIQRLMSRLEEVRDDMHAKESIALKRRRKDRESAGLNGMGGG